MRIFCQMAVILALVAFGGCWTCRSPDCHRSARVIWTRPICAKEGRYAGWPTVTRLRNGELVAVFSGDRDSHVCPWGKVQCVRSTDQGETWSEPVTIVNDPLDDRDAGLLELKCGRQVLFYFNSVAFRQAKYRTYWERHPDWLRHYEKIGGDEVVKPLLGAWSRYSDDGGRTWSEPCSTVVSTPHGAVVLKDGRLLLLGRKGDPAVGGCTFHAVESRDGGVSWKLIADIDIASVEPHWSLGEPSLFEGLDGTLHGYFRYEPGDGCLLQTTSTDGGRTWSQLTRSDIDGFPPHFLRLKDGSVVCSYARRKNKRTGVFARVSHDDGKIWGEEIELVRDENPDLGYASSVELDDGALLTVYYMHFNHAQRASVCATKWFLRTETNMQVKTQGGR